MDRETVNKILKINSDFYLNQAEQFHLSRNSCWQGWIKLKKYLYCWRQKICILDLGCGNGRLINFLQSNLISQKIDFYYLGIDQSIELLNIAQDNFKQFGNIEFKNMSLMNGNLSSSIHKKFNLIFMIAVLHHLPGENNRFRVLSEAVKLLQDKGYLVISLWKFAECAQQKKKILEINQWSKFTDIRPEQLQQNDYFLSWQNIENIRYCHYFNDQETKNIKIYLNNHGLKLTEQFRSDGKTKNLNEYLIFRKK
ncbi:MAG: class I SAM-dependent methyltransferase [bacterium]